MKYKTAKEFIKHHMEVFGASEWKAECDGQVIKSKGHFEVDGNWVNPYVANKMESKNDGKMSSLRSSKKAYKRTK